MATVAISASLQRACSSNHATKKQQPQIRPARSVGTKQVSNVVTLNVEGQKSLDIVEQQETSSLQTEAKRRRLLERYPESATNQEPVVFRSSIIPWWAWLRRSHPPEAELLNVELQWLGFFMAYIVDALTGLDVVGQTGNLVCKAGVFLTVVGVILFRQTEDFKKLKNLADEATMYNKQWQDQNSDSGNKI
ncbi:hypothetical protein Patl1_01372 [Pistacia atlantica]|uniref:Uncharacterized protein n=1 Tax=Pistacia atlantica TaxID=434234 RepID=A0ACC1C526_9ROSI|nr:hypothetical protein Patl1_01372 [Pistacia atlantica]